MGQRWREVLRARTVRIGMVVAAGAALTVARLTAQPPSAQDVAVEFANATLAADCERWEELLTERSRRFVDALGGCWLEDAQAGRVAGTQVQDRTEGAAVVAVRIFVDGSGLRTHTVVVREDEDGWGVDITAAQACATADGRAPAEGDCTPASIEGG